MHPPLSVRRAANFVAAVTAAVLASCSEPPTPPAELPIPGSAASVGADQTVLFGPRRLTRGAGPPNQYSIKLVEGTPPAGVEYLLRIENGDAEGAHRISSARVWIDGTLVLSPQELSQRVAVVQKRVPLRAGSVLTAELAGADRGFLEVSVVTASGDGGSAELARVASFSFPSTFFPTAEPVAVSQTHDPAATALFEEFENLYRVTDRATYQVRLLAGTSAPDGSFTAVLSIPRSLRVERGHEPELFAQVYAAGDLDIHDEFQLFESRYDPGNRTITATLPAGVFTNARRSDGRYEAIFMIAVTPGVSEPPAAPSLLLPSLSATEEGASGACKAAMIGHPLADNPRVSDTYRVREVHPITGDRKMHWGVDFAVPNGTSVQAAADGTIEKIGNQGSVGHGLYVVLRHADGAATLYSHLQRTLAARGQSVALGDRIALSNDSGGSTKPHLHFEYVPNGQIVGSKERIDPLPCIVRPKQTYSGYWTRDGGGRYNVFEAEVTFGSLPTVKWTFLPSDVRVGQARLEGEKVVWEYIQPATSTYPVTHRLRVTFGSQGCEGVWHHDYVHNNFFQHTSYETCKIIDPTMPRTLQAVPQPADSAAVRGP